MRAITYKMEISDYRVLAEIQPGYFNDDHWECSTEPSAKEIKIIPENGWEKVFPYVQTDGFYEEEFERHYREILRDGYLGYRLNAFSIGYEWITLIYVNATGKFQGVTIWIGSDELSFRFEGPATQTGIVPIYNVVMDPRRGGMTIEEDLGATRRYTEFKLKDASKKGEQRIAPENVYATVTEFTEI